MMMMVGLGDQDFLERKILQHLKHLANALYLPFSIFIPFIALYYILNGDEYKKILNLGWKFHFRFSLFFITRKQGIFRSTAKEKRSEVRCKEIKKQYKYNFYIPTHYYITYIQPSQPHPTMLSKLTALLPKSIPFPRCCCVYILKILEVRGMEKKKYTQSEIAFLK